MGGYIANDPEAWKARRTAKPEQQKTLATLLSRSPKWSERVNKRAQFLRRIWGYSHVEIQSAEDWVAAFQNALLTIEFWSERKSFLKLSKCGPRRMDLNLMYLYFLAQHSVIQYKNPREGVQDPEDRSPFEELRTNHHNLDFLLLRHLHDNCCMPRRSNPLKRNMFFTCFMPIYHWVLGPRADYIAPTAMSGWVHVAQFAAGVTTRSADTIKANWDSTAQMPSVALRQRAVGLLRKTITIKDLRWVLQVCISVAYLIFYVLHRHWRF